MIRWSDAKVDRLRALVIKGCTAAEIAAELGEGLTPNAVLGKTWRLGLALKPISVTTVAVKRVERVSPPKVSPPKVSPATASAAVPVQVGAGLPTEPISFMATRDDQCRFSVDLPARPAADMLVCGAPTIPGQSWCPACASRVFNRSGDGVAKLQRTASHD